MLLPGGSGYQVNNVADHGASYQEHDHRLDERLEVWNRLDTFRHRENSRSQNNPRYMGSRFSLIPGLETNNHRVGNQSYDSYDCRVLWWRHVKRKLWVHHLKGYKA